MPGPVRRGVGILAIHRKRQRDPPHAVGEIPFVLSSHFAQMALEPLLGGHRQHRPPIFLTFAPSNDDFMPVEVEILDSKLETLLQTQSGPIEEGHD